MRIVDPRMNDAWDQAKQSIRPVETWSVVTVPSPAQFQEAVKAGGKVHLELERSSVRFGSDVVVQGEVFAIPVIHAVSCQTIEVDVVSFTLKPQADYVAVCVSRWHGSDCMSGPSTGTVTYTITCKSGYYTVVIT